MRTERGLHGIHLSLLPYSYILGIMLVVFVKYFGARRKGAGIKGEVAVLRVRKYALRVRE